ncbi:RrF2 family transcriptional regulator [Paenibacillus sp. GCM10027626]|uniref:RrF2 family transcriptional regulator n=1 Tax=Paenibacillus sp. GCM10027626 TaxID=3273411 RepID=UPI003625D812
MLDNSPGAYKFRTTLSVLSLLAKKEGFMSSSEMAKLLQIHAVYLRKIISQLLKLGLVEAKEGRVGGYRLKMDAASISLADAYEALKGDKKSTCEPHQTWRTLKQVTNDIDACMMNHLKKYKISDLE